MPVSCSFRKWDLAALLKPGVYRFYKGSVLLYVGATHNLLWRLGGSCQRNASDANRIEFETCGSAVEAFALEAKQIAELKPLRNKMNQTGRPYSKQSVGKPPCRWRYWGRTKSKR